MRYKIFILIVPLVHEVSVVREVNLWRRVWRGIKCYEMKETSRADSDYDTPKVDNGRVRLAEEIHKMWILRCGDVSHSAFCGHRINGLIETRQGD